MPYNLSRWNLLYHRKDTLLLNIIDVWRHGRGTIRIAVHYHCYQFGKVTHWRARRQKKTPVMLTNSCFEPNFLLIYLSAHSKRRIILQNRRSPVVHSALRDLCVRLLLLSRIAHAQSDSITDHFPTQASFASSIRFDCAVRTLMYMKGKPCATVPALSTVSKTSFFI